MDTNGHTILSEDYVSFEVAKLLKEKGFDEACRSYFIDNVDYVSFSYNVEELTDLNMGVWETLRPTHQMAIKWLREVHKIFIEIGISIDLNGDYHYGYTILDDKCRYVRRGYTSFDWNFEDAVEAALKYVLENLI